MPALVTRMSMLWPLEIRLGIIWETDLGSERSKVTIIAVRPRDWIVSRVWVWVVLRCQEKGQDGVG